MKYVVLVFLLAFAPIVLPQQPKSKSIPGKKPAPVASAAKNITPAKKKPAVQPLSEKERFDKASGHELAVDRVAALEKFLADFPNSEHRLAAIDLLSSSRVLIAEEKLLSGETADAVMIFKTVVEQVPQPIPNELFNESIAKIPTALFFRGQRSAAIDLAMMIESKIETNPAQLLEIANFYLSIENGSDAMRIAAKAAAKEPNAASVHRTLALAHRINFDLELSAESYAKALELDPTSFAAKLGLADMKRAQGKSEEALALYRELVQDNEKSVPARTGLVLALFESGKRTEAEAEVANAVAQPRGNVILLAGAAYWYASKGLGEKAIELAQKAIEREPRYIWSHIALARGLMSTGKPVEAEQALLKARAYGNFPTLEYELASARIAAGFFREAAEDLQRQFTVTPSGNVRTKLGGRVIREEKSLADLVASERKASIFAPFAADTPENAEALRALLILDQKLQAVEPKEDEVAAAADAFAKGSDRMRLHRQLYVASLLLQKRIALPKVLDLARAVTGQTDTGLEVANPRAAVMASELYEARSAAFRRNEYLAVPDVPKQTLSAILRGRVEEITGWALYQQNNFPEAIVRLRRAISVMPDKSAWWRSSMWRLGAALAADGKDAEALNSYIESYKTDKPDFAKYSVVEALYRKVNGTLDGLEAKLGPERVISAPTPPDAAAIPVVEPPRVEAAGTATVSGNLSPSTPVVSTTRTNPETTPVKTGTPAGITERENTKAETSNPLTSTELVKTDNAAQTSKPEPKKIDAPTEDSKSVVTIETPKPEPSKSEPAKIEETKVTDEPRRPVIQPAEKTESPLENQMTQPVSTNPSPKKSEAPERNDLEVVTRSEKETNPPAASTSKAPPSKSKQAVPKPLFEPIIITIPRPPKVGDGRERPRVAENSSVETEAVSPCTVGVSQDHVSLLNSGGTVGILVSLEGPGDIKTMTATSSSPKDVSVTLEPEIVGMSDRRFYVLKSLSSNLGIYQVTFAAPCGKKDIVITIR